MKPNTPRQRKLRILGIALLPILAILTFALWPRSTTPFKFLEGKPIALRSHLTTGYAALHTSEIFYVFKVDWPAFIAKAGQELRVKGWKQDQVFYPTSGVKEPQDVMAYSKGDRKVVFFKNSNLPNMMMSSTYLPGDYTPNMLTVLYQEWDDQPSLSERIHNWLKGLFGQKATSQSE